MSVRPVLLVAALATALALAAGACGGDGGGDLASGAEIAPASSAILVSIDTDFDGDQWETAEDLIEKFPSGREELQKLPGMLEDEDVDFERDVKPAVGPEVNLVLLDFADEDALVILTQPEDEAKWRELVGKSDEPAVTAEVEGGWWAAAESQELLDRFVEARGDDSLASSDAFEETMDELPGEALATLYVNGEALSTYVRAESETTPEERQSFECLFGGADVSSMAFSLAAEDDGARFGGAVPTGDREVPDEYASELAAELPEGALFFGSVRDLGRQIRDVLRCVSDANQDAAAQIAQAELALGVSLEEDLLPLFDGETAYALYRPAESQLAQATDGFGLPTITLVTEVEDEARARELADRIADRASAFLGGVSVADADVGGIAARRVTVGGQGSLFYAVFDGKLVLTSTEDGLLGFGEEGPRLSEDEEYEGAREAAGAPDEAAGFAYANVAQALDVLYGFFEGVPGGPPSETRDELRPLRSLFFWSEADDDMTTFEGFLRIE